MSVTSNASSGWDKRPPIDMYSESVSPFRCVESTHSRDFAIQNFLASYVSPAVDEVLTFEHSGDFHVQTLSNDISYQCSATPTFVVPSSPLPPIPPLIIVVAHPSGPQYYTHSGAHLLV